MVVYAVSATKGASAAKGAASVREENGKMVLNFKD